MDTAMCLPRSASIKPHPTAQILPGPAWRSQSHLEQVQTEEHSPKDMWYLWPSEEGEVIFFSF